MNSLSNKKQSILKIKKTEGLSYIIKEASQILGNPIFVFNMEYELLAHAGGEDTDDFICAEFIKNGRLSAETIEFFKDEDFIDAVASCNGVIYLTSENLKYDRIFGQLYSNKLSPVADLVIVACENPFEETSQELVATLCSVISSEFIKDPLYQAYGQTYQENVVRLLIDGNVENNKGIYAGHVSNIDNTLKDYIFLGIADIKKAAPAYSKLARYKNLFIRTCPEFRYFLYSDYIVMLLSFDRKEFDLDRDLKKLCTLLKKSDAYLGISDCFENLFNLSVHYKQALSALEKGLKNCGSKRIFLYGDIMPVL